MPADEFVGIGVAGCGRMGAPMLTALRSAGFDAHGFDISGTRQLTGLWRQK